MPVTIDSVCADARSLPREARVDIVDRLLADIYEDSDPELERIWLETARRRRDEVRSGAVKAIPGEEVLAEARELVER